MKSLKEYIVKEDSVDIEKHDKLNDIFMALEKLSDEVYELEALDAQQDSSGVGDLNDQLVTFRKMITGLYQVIDRSSKVVPIDAQDRAGDEYRDAKRISDSVNEAVDQELMDEVIMQVKRDCDMGDYTAIEELLMSCPEDKLRGFLSEVDESNELSTLKRLAGIEEDVDQQYKDVLATRNDIKINRFLAKQPEDVAKRLTGTKAQPKIKAPRPGSYSHSTNPEFPKKGM